MPRATTKPQPKVSLGLTIEATKIGGRPVQHEIDMTTSTITSRIVIEERDPDPRAGRWSYKKPVILEVVGSKIGENALELKDKLEEFLQARLAETGAVPPVEASYQRVQLPPRFTPIPQLPPLPLTKKLMYPPGAVPEPIVYPKANG